MSRIATVGLVVALVSGGCNRDFPLPVSMDAAVVALAPTAPELNYCVPGRVSTCCVDVLIGSAQMPFTLQSDPNPDPTQRNWGTVHTDDGALTAGPDGGGWSIIIDASRWGKESARIETTWFWLTMDATLPAGTSITARVRSGPTPVPDNRWSTWTSLPSTSSAIPDLTPLGSVHPYLQIELGLGSAFPERAPMLRRLDVAFTFECGLPG